MPEDARNVQQIKNFHEKPEDPMLDLIEMLKQGERDSKTAFVCKVETLSDVCIVLATDHQLSDIKRFCTNASQFSVLGVDPTFNFWKILHNPNYV